METRLAYRALLQFGAGISAGSISASQSGNDLVLTISATDSITVKDWFGSINYRLGQIQFDGEEPQSAQSFVDNLLNPPIE
ncbi:calcium-binding protein [Ketobacter alkanivorans]|uniref:Haemolysin-type calcium binding-related domain-containing protein n=1 Tax=Ketobacter alkanivorans TaxID=1917421 RepID=A0A2K9LQA1_9GAMM|nr:calcium-binding protein [Ketobacter alkanivorans]AUM13004.1 hypothetical protein Kalk_11480 [Ketobacter alkanivorans]